MRMCGYVGCLSSEQELARLGEGPCEGCSPAVAVGGDVSERGMRSHILLE